VTDPDEAFWTAIEAATSYKKRDGLKHVGSDAFNRAAGHAVGLLHDAASAYARGSYGTATFLALTALEETAKAELLRFRKSNPTLVEEGKGRDPLLSHKTKHVLAVRPTVFMCERLPAAIGADRCSHLQLAAASGELVKLREKSLYVSFEGDEIVTPQEAITLATAREVLLLAIEAADDVLVGWTNLSMTWSPALGALFREVAAQDR
jgi:AbiV family abortive infection protein